MNRFTSPTVCAALTLLLPLVSYAGDSTLSLPEALEEARKEYGPLLAQELSKSSAKGILEKASVLPNPEFSFSWEDLSPSNKPAFEAGNFVFELQYPLALGGKRSARIDVASAEAELAALEAEKETADLLLEISEAFLDLQEKNSGRLLAQQRSRQSERLANIAKEKFRAGKLSGIEQSRLTSLAALAEIELGEREIQATKSSRRFSSFLGKKAHSPLVPNLNFEAVDRIDLSKEVFSQPLAERIARARAEKSNREFVLASKEAIPDLILKSGMTLERSSNEKLFSVGFSLPLPLFDRNQGAVLVAESVNKSDNAIVRGVEISAINDREDLHKALEFLKSKSEHLKNEVLPTLRSSAALLTEAYEQGKVTYVEVVETQESLFAVEEKYLETLSQLHRTTFRLAFSDQARLGLVRIKKLYGVEVKQ